MSHPPYLRDHARRLRVDKAMSIDEIGERLALPKTTIYGWVRDLPLRRPRSSPAQRKGNRAMRYRYWKIREDAYQTGVLAYVDLARTRSFRDFVVLYIAEGYKRDRNTVAIGNSDAAMMRFAHQWICRLTGRRLHYGVQYHADQDLRLLQQFWSSLLGVAPDDIKLQRKSNSGQLAGRVWRSEHGVLTVRVYDTAFRARLQAWIDIVREGWALH